MLPPDIGKVEFGLKRTGLGDNDLKIGGHATPEKHRGIGNSMMKGCNPFFSNNFLCFYLFELHKGIGDLLYRFQQRLLEFKFRLLTFYF